MKRILITGAIGQIGSDLTVELRRRFGNRNVVATDIREPRSPDLLGEGPFEWLDVLHQGRLMDLVEQYEVDTIYHLAAILSALAETRPTSAWQINVGGAVNVLEVARRTQVSQVFIPSSIAAFGPSTPLDHTPQDTIQRPTSIYGISKVTTELLGDYYYRNYGVDCRGVRLPGIISYKTSPGGGTTDYAIDMLIHAAEGRPYTCYLEPDTRMDMMYVPDALRACIEIMEADGAKLRHRNAFNVTAMQFTPRELAEEIQRQVPNFDWTWEVDPLRQAIADSWPNSMDDSVARKEWGWTHRYDLPKTVEDMLLHLRRQRGLG